MIRSRNRTLPLSPVLALLLGLLGGTAAAGAAEPEVRLLVAGAAAGRLEAGLEILLPDGWKTYWRTPGDAGMPPNIETGASRGLADVALRFPAPERFDEAGLTALGYTATVILPIDGRLVDPTRAGRLDVSVAIGLCHDICVPLETRVSADVDPARPIDGGQAARIAAARARVPAAAVDGGVPDVTALRRVTVGAREEIEVEVAMPAADGRHDVLVEGPSADWALPLPERRGPAGPRETWVFAVDGVPKGADLATVDLRVTLIAGDRAVERMRRLDGAATAP